MVKLAYFYTPTDRTKWPNDLFMNFKGSCPRIPSAIMRIEHTFLRYTFKWNNISIHVVWHCHFELKFNIDCNFNYAKFGFFINHENHYFLSWWKSITYVCICECMIFLLITTARLYIYLAVVKLKSNKMICFCIDAKPMKVIDQMIVKLSNEISTAID